MALLWARAVMTEFVVMGIIMRALVCNEWGPAEKLTIEELPDPTPGAGQVLVDIKAGGLNFPDTLMIEGKYQFRPDFPFTPGGEAAGVVSALGEGVTDVAIGDRVLVTTPIGAFAEKCVAQANMIMPMPDNMTFEQAAGFTTTYATSYYALKNQAKIQPGETIAVLGAAGGVGVTAIEIAKAMGAKVIACASTEEKLDFACRIGADERLNYTKQPLKETLKELTGGKGVDVVYDPVGGEFSEQALRATAWDGRFLVIGFAAGDIPRIPLNLALLKGVHIIGVFWGGWYARDPIAVQNNNKELLQMVTEEKLKPLITETYSLDQYVDAFDCLTERRAKGKVILTMD